MNCSIGRHSPVSLAYSNGHFDTCLKLLNANSKFPDDITQKEIQHDGLKSFFVLTENVHMLLIANNEQEIKRILIENQNLRHFFNLNNLSAPYKALSMGFLDIYNIFLSNNVVLSSTESFSDAVENLSETQKVKLREIHKSHAKGFSEKHLMIISSNIFVGHDLPHEERDEKLIVAQNAIIFLNSIANIRPILMLIANARCFKIIFDFNRLHIQFIDPTSSENARGKFYLTHHIYIAAKNLLNSANCYQVYGTLAHELCHFAMDLAYDNKCRPYKESDRKTVGVEFFEVFKSCRILRKNDDVIDAVFNYSNNMQIQELIVRVPHLTALYANNEARFNELAEIFEPLFDFYNNRVLPDVIQAAETIEAEVCLRREAFLDETFKKVSKWRKVAKISIISLFLVALTVAIIVSSVTYKRTYKWDELTDDEKISTKNGKVRFTETDLTFCDLFEAYQSSAYEVLNSNQISQLINGEILDLSDVDNQYLESYINLMWSNLTENLRQKVLNAQIYFQYQYVLLHQIIDNETDILNFLDSNEIFALIKNISWLTINEMNFNYNEIFIERELISADMDDLYTYEESEKKSFDFMIYESEQNRIEILSDNAGSGKTMFFKHCVWQFSQEFPFKWVSYIDLKKNIPIFKTIKTRNNFNLQNVFNILVEILNLDSDFEINIFAKMFNTYDVILLFDGFDEISPDFSNVALEIFKVIYADSYNQQWISTRPLYKQQLQNVFNFTINKLSPYTSENNNEYLTQYFQQQNLNEDETNHASENFKIICYKMGVEYIESPLMLQIFADISINHHESDSFDVLNLFSVYERFVTKKFEILKQKGELVDNDRIKVEQMILTITEAYEYYAIKLLLSSDYFIHFKTNMNIELKSLKLVKKFEKVVITQDVNLDQLSRYGILNAKSWDEADFVHRSIAEFYLAKYFVDYIFNVLDDPKDSEAELRLLFLFHVLYTPQFVKTVDFIYYYAKLKRANVTLDDQFSTLIETRYIDAFYHYLPRNDEFITNILSLSYLVNENLFCKLWSCYKNETLLTRLATNGGKKIVGSFQRLLIENKELFHNESALTKLLHGKFQRGNFFFEASNIRRKGVNFLMVQSLSLIEYSSDHLIESNEYLLLLNLNLDLNYEKLMECANFVEFFNLMNHTLNIEEKCEIFRRNFVEIFTHHLETENDINIIWNEIERIFDASEIETLLTSRTTSSVHLLFFLQIQDDLSVSKMQNYFKKVEKYVKNDTMIYEMLYGVCTICYSSLERIVLMNFNHLKKNSFFKYYWKFVEKHSTLDDRREILSFWSSNDKYPGNLLNLAFMHASKENLFAIKKAYKKYFTVDERKKFGLEYLNMTGKYKFQHVISNETILFISKYFEELFTNEELRSIVQDYCNDNSRSLLMYAFMEIFSKYLTQDDVSRCSRNQFEKLYISKFKLYYLNYFQVSTVTQSFAGIG